MAGNDKGTRKVVQMMPDVVPVEEELIAATFAFYEHKTRQRIIFIVGLETDGGGMTISFPHTVPPPNHDEVVESIRAALDYIST